MARHLSTLRTFLVQPPEPVLVGTQVRVTRGEEVDETILAPGVAQYLSVRHPDIYEITNDETGERDAHAG